MSYGKPSPMPFDTFTLGWNLLIVSCK